MLINNTLLYHEKCFAMRRERQIHESGFTSREISSWLSSTWIFPFANFCNNAKFANVSRQKVVDRWSNLLTVGVRKTFTVFLLYVFFEIENLHLCWISINVSARFLCFLVSCENYYFIHIIYLLTAVVLCISFFNNIQCMFECHSYSSCHKLSTAERFGITSLSITLHDRPVDAAEFQATEKAENFSLFSQVRGRRNDTQGTGCIGTSLSGSWRPSCGSCPRVQSAFSSVR